MSTVLDLLAEKQRNILAKRHPERWRLFQSNPPASIHDYVIGMTDGELKVSQCNERGYSIIFPAEKNREAIGMSNMNRDRSMSGSLGEVLDWVWTLRNRRAEMALESAAAR